MVNVVQTKQVNEISVNSNAENSEINVDMSISNLTQQIIDYVNQIEIMLREVKQYVNKYVDLNLDIPTKISDLNDDVGISSFINRIDHYSTLREFGITDAVMYEEIEE